MPKDFSLPNMVQDLHYAVNGTYVHQWLHSVCPPREGLTVLEPGCGCGKFGLSYALKGAHVTLFDIDQEVVEYCHRLKKALDVLREGAFHFAPFPLSTEIMVADLFTQGPYAHTANLVFNEGVPQHWPDEEHRQGCINRMATWAKPGGLVVIVGNNGNNPRELETDRSMKFTYEGMPPQRKCFTSLELVQRLEKAGLRQVQTAYLGGGPGDAILIAGWGRKP